jgi:D-3-phosphoglycerate dehydrogenase
MRPPAVQKAPPAGESQAVESLLLDLLEWIGPAARPYDEVLDAWRTLCPRLPVWEEAKERGFVTVQRDPLRGRCVAVSVAGIEHLRDLRENPRT